MFKLEVRSLGMGMRIGLERVEPSVSLNWFALLRNCMKDTASELFLMRTEMLKSSTKLGAWDIMPNY